MLTVAEEALHELAEQYGKEVSIHLFEQEISGGTVWQVLESRFGNDGAADVLEKLGKFKGARGFSAPGEVYVFKSSQVRDAEKAAFDPARVNDPSIYGRATAPVLLGTAGFGASGLLGQSAAHRMGYDLLPRSPNETHNNRPERP